MSVWLLFPPGCFFVCLFLSVLCLSLDLCVNMSVSSLVYFSLSLCLSVCPLVSLTLSFSISVLSLCYSFIISVCLSVFPSDNLPILLTAVAYRLQMLFLNRLISLVFSLHLRPVRAPHHCEIPWVARTHTALMIKRVQLVIPHAAVSHVQLKTCNYAQSLKNNNIQFLVNNNLFWRNTIRGWACRHCLLYRN